MFEKNSKLLIIGDSITDCGRARPVGEWGGLGNGYMSYIDALLQVGYPELGIRVVNQGISGDTTRHLRARWDSDVIAQKPDYLGVMIGVNDVWRSFDNPHIKEACVPLEEYTAILRELLAKTTAKKVFLMTPFFLELNKSDKFRAKLDTYCVAVKAIAEEMGHEFVDIQAAFDAFMERGVYGMTISGDRVHPNGMGSLLIAKTFLKAAGFDFGVM